MVSRSFVSFLKDKRPSAKEALAALRYAYLFSFAVKAVSAFATCFVLALFLDRAARSEMTSTLWTLLAFDILLLPMVVLGAKSVARAGGKRAAIKACLVTGIFLSSSVWLALFAFFLGAPTQVLLVFVTMIAMYYAFGVFFSSSFVSTALSPSLTEPREGLEA